MKVVVLFGFIFFSFSVIAQKKHQVIFHIQNNETIPKNINYKSEFKTKEKAINSLILLKNKLFSEGYIESSIDSFNYNNFKLHTYLYIGSQYQLTALENGNINKEVIDEIKFSENLFNNKIFSLNEISKIENKILEYYENNGFPFAEVFLDSVSIIDNNISSKLFAKPHSSFVIDTIRVHGNSNTKSIYLQNFLGIKKGDLFDKSKIDKISSKISQLKFIKENRNFQILFLNGKVEINIFLQKQKSNEVNLLLGLLPNDKLTNRKLTISGDGRLHLFNSFGVGEEIFIDFKQLKPKTQNMDVKFTYPYFINLPIGVNGEFNLYKNDTSYVNINSKVGLIYFFNGVDNLQLFFQNQTSNILNFDTINISDENSLNILDKSTNNIGLKFYFQKLDYVLNPRKGYNITFLSKIGSRKIKENNILKSKNPDYYDNIKKTSINLNIEFEIDYFLPIYKRHSILLSNNTKKIFINEVLKNEKYRIGGANSLRGFDEEDIITSYFSMFTLEYHFSLTKNSYFYTFGEFAIVEDNRNNSFDIPFGFGVGTTFETKGGILSLNYALGKQLDNKIELKNGKIHFGYINYF